MKTLRILIILALSLSGFSLYSQFGLSARIQNSTNKAWNETFRNETGLQGDLMNRSYEFGVNYWFRMKNYRLEFLPELSYATARTEIDAQNLDLTAHTRKSYNFNLNMQLYPLDFYGDCDCPTFSKDGNMVSKGFYWLLSPGISRHTLGSEFSSQSGMSVDDASITSFRIGIGAGVDIGLTNLFTVSPFIQYSMNFGNSWPEQFTAYGIANPENDNNSSNINQWHFGARLIFRPDYKY